jgi:hypothetical protein
MDNEERIVNYELFMPLLLATSLSVFVIDDTTQRSQLNPRDQTTHMLGAGMMGRGHGSWLSNWKSGCRQTKTKPLML